MAGDTALVTYDEDLAGRLRELLQAERGLTEKKMFGGLAFLIDGNMSVSASSRGGLLVRVDPDETEKLLSEPHAHPFEMRNRAMQGWLGLTPRGCRASASSSNGLLAGSPTSARCLARDSSP